MGGADLVLELPVCFACASAPRFAEGAVSVLELLGVVDDLAFGSECGDISVLENAARILAQNPPDYAGALKAGLRAGHTFPAAQSKALSLCDPKSAHILETPNNLLGVEYCRALFARNSTVRPVTIPRKGSGYRDADLREDFGSALAVRTALQKKGTAALETVRPHVPVSVFSLMEHNYKKLFPVFPDMLSQMLHYKLLSETPADFTPYLDVSGELSDRIVRQLPSYRDFVSFCTLLKTKEMTYARISRSLLHILLNIKREDALITGKEEEKLYARMLGFRSSAAPLLTAIKANGSIPLISKLADAHGYLKEPAMSLLSRDIQAARLYNALILHAYGIILPGEMQRQIFKI